MKSYNELLELTIEIEGLLLLKLNRGDSAPAEVDSLLRLKAAALADGLDTAGSVTEAGIEAEEKENAEAVADNLIFEETEDADIPAVELDPEPEPTSEHSKPEPVTVADSLAHDSLSVNQTASATPDIAHAFTLNDKFRFRRELFRNSNEEFTETIDVLNAMQSLEEAEDYLYNDLAWDADNADVKAFISIIAPCYSMS